jgi:hypothetical protein
MGLKIFVCTALFDSMLLWSLSGVNSSYELVFVHFLLLIFLSTFSIDVSLSPDIGCIVLRSTFALLLE